MCYKSLWNYHELYVFSKCMMQECFYIMTLRFTSLQRWWQSKYSVFTVMRFDPRFNRQCTQRHGNIVIWELLQIRMESPPDETWYIAPKLLVRLPEKASKISTVRHTCTHTHTYTYTYIYIDCRDYSSAANIWNCRKLIESTKYPNCKHLSKLLPSSLHSRTTLPHWLNESLSFAQRLNFLNGNDSHSWKKL